MRRPHVALGLALSLALLPFGATQPAQAQPAQAQPQVQPEPPKVLEASGTGFNLTAVRGFLTRGDAAVARGISPVPARITTLPVMPAAACSASTAT